MKKSILLFLIVLLTRTVFAQTFSLPGDGKWYRVVTVGGLHARFTYVYSHGTANNPSVSSGEIDFINAVNTLVQHHQTMGFQAWNQPQFALINFGNTSEVWVKAKTGVDAGNFKITEYLNATLNLGDASDSDLSDNGGTLTVYDQLKDNANTFYSDLIVPLNHVSIGTGNIDPNYSLAVKGKIHAQEVLVELTNWPDYVFKPEYTLMPLMQLKSYIDQNHHLPDMPAAADVEKNGQNLGEINKLLTKKVEELTLYLINQQKINESLQDQINVMKKILEKNIQTTNK